MIEDELFDIIESAIRHEIMLRPMQSSDLLAYHVAREVIRQIDEHELIVKERLWYNPDEEYDDLE